MKNKLAIISISSVILVFWSVDVMGQIQNIPEPQMNVNPPPPGLVVPIDGGISLLATAGMILGIYFLRIKR